MVHRQWQCAPWRGRARYVRGLEDPRHGRNGRVKIIFPDSFDKLTRVAYACKIVCLQPIEVSCFKSALVQVVDATAQRTAVPAVPDRKRAR